jgi:hypothetical protein
MIEFATEPDTVFLAILTEALEWTMEDLYTSGEELAHLEEWYPVKYPSLAHFFTRDELRPQVERLRTALNEQTIYRITDYHWLVLHESLEMFSDLHNDGAFGKKRDGRVGPYTIDQIDLDHVLDIYFFDTDFLFGSELFVAEEDMRSPPAVTPQARKIAAGIKPSGEDLEITPIEPGNSQTGPAELTYPASGYIGPYPMRERSNDL